MIARGHSLRTVGHSLRTVGRWLAFPFYLIAGAVVGLALVVALALIEIVLAIKSTKGRG